MCHIMKCLTILCPYGPNKGQSSNFIVTGWPCKFAEKKTTRRDLKQQNERKSSNGHKKRK